MATDTPNAPTTPSAPTPPREIRIISHSSLFYWWPVWAVGFLLSLITLFTGDRMAAVPGGSEIYENASVSFKTPDGESRVDGRSVIAAPKGEKLNPPKLLISRSKNLGVLFVVVLLVVITITNIPLRGLWSVIVIVFILFAVVLLAVLQKWDEIMDTLSLLDIRINLGGYMVISCVLFALWFIVFSFFDRQLYMVFTPGQLRVKLEIGDAETAYDTTGMTIQKQRSDLFRHWILGLGSGDLIVKTSGAQHHHFDMHNVLFVGRKVKEIEEMLRSRQVVTNTSN